MKTTLSHLSQEKQDELKRIVQALEDFTEVEMVILFGSYATGKQVERDRYEENGIMYVYMSDFDLLVITKNNHTADNPNFVHKISKAVKKERAITPISPIVEGITFVNQLIEKGNYFFNDVVEEGIVLYDSGNQELAKKGELNPEETKEQAQESFDEWFESANDFYEYFEVGFAKQKYKTAAFQLHQATERYYHTVSLVFTNYKHRLHDLEDLGKIAASFNLEFKKVFPRKTAQEKHCYHLLLRAYIDSRYKKGYSISKEELAYLGTRVTKLRNLTKLLCEQKIEEFNNENKNSLK